MSTLIPYGRQNITAEDIQAVVEVLKSDFLTQGPTVKIFEDAFAKYIGCKYAVAVSNGTAALHLCTLALGVKKGDKVITTPITFAASANAIRYCDGEVLFTDIDKETYLMDLNKVKALLEASPKGTYQGIIPVDFAGRAIDLEKLRELADEFGMWILEDACHAPGGFFTDSKGEMQRCGNGKFADLSIFSFHPVKHIATGEGGMITTDNEELYQKLLMLRTHGITRDSMSFENTLEFAIGEESVNPGQLTADKNWPGWYMEMQTLGYNYRLTDFQAALGLSQLHKAPAGLEKRIQIASKYETAFTDKSYIKGQSGLINGHAYHLYIIEVDHRLGLYNYLRKNNILAQVHYIPCHLMPYYRSFGWKEGDMPYAENYYKHCISLPMYPSLTDAEQDFVISTIEKFYNA